MGRTASVLLLAAWLTACGGGDDGAQTQDPTAAAEDVSCPAGIPDFHTGAAGIGLETGSQSMAIKARILDAKPLTPARFYNDWTVQFLDAQGMPVNDIAINSACAWMYVHNHGGPPMTVTQLADPSTYKLTALNLFMRGPWSIELAVSSPSHAGPLTETTMCAVGTKTPAMDKIVIPICVMDE